MPNYWLIKTEPSKYSWDDLVEEEEGVWDGVRNHTAKNNLAAMEVGDLCFFYHSREGLEIVGIAEVTVAGIADPTDETGKWAAVKVKPKEKLSNPITLKRIKAEPKFGQDGAGQTIAPVGFQSIGGGVGESAFVLKGWLAALTAP